jgi:hypothetical protein
VTNDVSPYLQRPVRKLEEVIAEAEQQRLEQGPTASVADAQKTEASPSITTAQS